MTNLANGTVVTDLDNHADNSTLASQGYSIRHVEIYHGHEGTFVTWDAPTITEADCPF